VGFRPLSRGIPSTLAWDSVHSHVGFRPLSRGIPWWVSGVSRCVNVSERGVMCFV